jgi:tetratricopeptide (TPR) repeat protein
VTREPTATTTVAGDDASALVARGRAELDGGKIDEAVASFERAAEQSPEDSEVYRWLGQAYLSKLQDASMFKKLSLSKNTRKAYLKSIELDPENIQARASLASFYFNAPSVAGGSKQKGLEQVEEIRKRDARTAHLLLGRMHNGDKEPAKAKQEYRAAIRLDPSDPDPYYILGVICQQEKEWEEAFEAFEAGVRETGDARSLYQIGRTAVFSGTHLERAKEALTQYIARAPEAATMPTEAHARWRLGMLYEKEGRKDLARREYREALKVDPDLEQAKEALETLGG